MKMGQNQSTQEGDNIAQSTQPIEIIDSEDEEKSDAPLPSAAHLDKKKMESEDIENKAEVVPAKLDKPLSPQKCVEPEKSEPGPEENINKELIILDVVTEEKETVEEKMDEDEGNEIEALPNLDDLEFPPEGSISEDIDKLLDEIQKVGSDAEVFLTEETKTNEPDKLIEKNDDEKMDESESNAITVEVNANELSNDADKSPEISDPVEQFDDSTSPGKLVIDDPMGTIEEPPKKDSRSSKSEAIEIIDSEDDEQQNDASNTDQEITTKSDSIAEEKRDVDMMDVTEDKNEDSAPQSISPLESNEESKEKDVPTPEDQSIVLDSDEEEVTPRPDVEIFPIKKTPTSAQIVAETKKAVESLMDDSLMKEEDSIKAPQTPPKDETKECISVNCQRACDKYYEAPGFILSHYNINKKASKMQYICEVCFDDAIVKYEELCGALIANKPLLLQNIPFQPDLVEISDSDTDDDGDDDKKKSTKRNAINEVYIKTDDPGLLLEENIENIIRETLAKVDIQQQYDWADEFMQEKLNKNRDETLKLIDEVDQYQKKVDQMHFNLYNKVPYRNIKTLEPIDLNQVENLVQTPRIPIPKSGSIRYLPIEIGHKYFAPKNLVGGAWFSCQAMEIYEPNTVDGRKMGRTCKMQFLRRAIVKILSTKYIAYSTAPEVILPVGTRVIAIYQQTHPVPKNLFFPGTIGETLTPPNLFRYLIFFDDGYCQYVRHENVRLICEPSDNVCDDIAFNPGTKTFIQDYLANYKVNSGRPMVQVKPGQKIITEFSGSWKQSKVVEIDCNLIKVFSEDRYEWIYRGSSRFAPLFKEKQGFKQLGNVHLRKRNEPYVEYIRYDDILSKSLSPDKNVAGRPTHQANESSDPMPYTRAVARKSTAPAPTAATQLNVTQGNQQQPQPSVKYLNNSVIVLDDDKIQRGKIIYYTATKKFEPRSYNKHKCNPSCLFRINDNLDPFNPIARPLLSGWERQISKTKTRKVAVYRAPCGKRMRNMYELHQYLRMTNCRLNVECFDFDTTIHCLAEHVDDQKYIINTDLSNGLEGMPIACCNYFDDSTPPPCVYSNKRIPREGVNLNLDPEFLCGCDCTDDCLDKTKCQCWQLTITGAKVGNPGLNDDDIGYVYKRLPNHVQTGIYECNSRCKCNKNCLNRVVQQPLSVKLQVFKTTNRGWGLRTLHDIPKGSFICIYAGDLLTEQMSNYYGAKDGDEYFAELDYIEVVERIKEGYESDVVDPDDDQRRKSDEDEEFELDDTERASGDSDDDFRAPCPQTGQVKRFTTRASLREKREMAKKSTAQLKEEIFSPKKSDAANNDDDDGCITISDDEDQPVREPVNFMPNTSYDGDETDNDGKSVRNMFGKNELGYVMDAKRTGNVGRYFNHSCNPNLFVQNVFVDTHDLRFPWVSFFAGVAIPASTELTWNYNYDVGCVPGKVLYCQCESYNCRGRLL